MATDCRDAEVAGLWIEIYDTRGNYVGHAVYFDWHAQPLPAVGDTLALELPLSSDERPHRVESRICARQFDLQHDENGRPAMWVRLIGRQCGSRPTGRPHTGASFSAN